MDTLGIKNVSQAKTWWQWYQNDELYRFHQPVGKQYTYGKNSYTPVSSDKGGAFDAETF